MAAQLKEEKASLENSLDLLDAQRSKIYEDLNRVNKQLEDIELHELSPN